MKDYWLECPWCGQVTRTTWKDGHEFCNSCREIVSENAVRNDTGTSGNGEDTD